MSLRKKPLILDKHKDVLNHPRFPIYLKALRPLERKVVTMFLEPEGTFKSISEAIDMEPRDVRYYFVAAMGKIRKCL